MILVWILVIVGLAGVIILSYKSIKENEWKSIFIAPSIIAILIAGYLCKGFDKQKIKLSRFDLTKEVRIESVNGEEISRDTIYIFTPRKEKSNHNLSRRVCK